MEASTRIYKSILNRVKTPLTDVLHELQTAQRLDGSWNTLPNLLISQFPNLPIPSSTFKAQYPLNYHTIWSTFICMVFCKCSNLDVDSFAKDMKARAEKSLKLYIRENILDRLIKENVEIIQRFVTQKSEENDMNNLLNERAIGRFNFDINSIQDKKIRERLTNYQKILNKNKKDVEIDEEVEREREIRLREMEVGSLKRANNMSDKDKMKEENSTISNASKEIVYKGLLYKQPAKSKPYKARKKATRIKAPGRIKLKGRSELRGDKYLLDISINLCSIQGNNGSWKASSKKFKSNLDSLMPLLQLQIPNFICAKFSSLRNLVEIWGNLVALNILYTNRNIFNVESEYSDKELETLEKKEEKSKLYLAKKGITLPILKEITDKYMEIIMERQKGIKQE